MNSIKPNKITRSWAWYDFANSSYVLIFQSFLLPVYFSSVLQTSGATLSSWGLVNGISTFAGVIIALVVGDYADKNVRLHIFNRLIIVSFLGMTLLSWSVAYNNILVPYLFVFTNAFFIASVSVSDSMLTFIGGEKNNTVKTSGFGWGFGYVGGIVCLLIVLGIQKKFGEYSSLTFLSVAIFYAIFSAVCANGLKNVNLNVASTASNGQSVLIKVRSYFWLMFGFWMIAEAITVTILFYSIYASSELKIESHDIAMTLLVIQIVAFFSTWLGGVIPQAYPHSRFAQPVFLLGLSIVIWVILIAYLSILVQPHSLSGLYLVAALTGLVIGNTQSYIRALYALSTEKMHAGRQFGIYSIITQAAALVGTWVYGIASDFMHSQRTPMLFVALTMVIGFLLIRSSIGSTSGVSD